MEVLVTFNLTHNAMKAKRSVLSDKLNAEIIPTPREISKECGFSLLMYETSVEFVREYFKKNELDFSIIYVRSRDKGKRHYEESN